MWERLRLEEKIPRLGALWKKFRTSRGYRVIQIGILGTSLGFLFYALVTNFSQIDSNLQLDISSLFLALLFTLISFWAGNVAWVVTVQAFNSDMSWSELVQINLISVAVKYFPGFGLQQLSKGWQLNRAGFTAKRTMLIVIFEFGALIFAALVLLASLASTHQHTLLGVRIDVPFGIAISGLVWLVYAMIPIAVLWIVQSENGERGLGWRFILSLWLAQLFDLLGWIALGSGFWLSPRAFYPLSIDTLSYSIEVLILSVLAGLIAIFAPNGYGVRELTISFLLQPILPVPLNIMAAILSRVVLVAVDLLGMLPLVAIRLSRKRY